MLVEFNSRTTVLSGPVSFRPYLVRSGPASGALPLLSLAVFVCLFGSRVSVGVVSVCARAGGWGEKDSGWQEEIHIKVFVWQSVYPTASRPV